MQLNKETQELNSILFSLIPSPSGKLCGREVGEGEETRGCGGKCKQRADQED